MAALAMLALAGPVALGAGQSVALPLRSERGAPTDLEIRGMIAGQEPGGNRYARWSDLMALPTARLRISDEFRPGVQEVTVLFLSDLLSALPLSKGADVVFATCNDQYASVYRFDFIGRYRPFLVLEIDGLGPDRWPLTGMTYNPGPYAILVSPTVVPEAARLLDLAHKKPWGVVGIEVGRFSDAFKDIYTGKWGTLSTRAAEGREIWINSCASCHQGPGSTFGGSKSGQPFALLEAVAAGNPAFLKTYVRNPVSLNPAAKMEPHPYYSDPQLDAIIAFILAEGSHQN
jgi:mono/diheme cytochrome c family protein